MQKNYLDLLPDELYKNVISFCFVPRVELSRSNLLKWNQNLSMINKCYKCNRNCTQVPLTFNCSCNNIHYRWLFPPCRDGCLDQLICWDCAH